MTALRTPQPDLPQMVSETLSHLREGYDSWEAASGWREAKETFAKSEQTLGDDKAAN